jgi:hypothetical protein
LHNDFASFEAGFDFHFIAYAQPEFDGAMLDLALYDLTAFRASAPLHNGSGG